MPCPNIYFYSKLWWKLWKRYNYIARVRVCVCVAFAHFILSLCTIAEAHRTLAQAKPHRVFAQFALTIAVMLAAAARCGGALNSNWLPAPHRSAPARHSLDRHKSEHTRTRVHKTWFNVTTCNNYGCEQNTSNENVCVCAVSVCMCN